MAASKCRPHNKLGFSGAKLQHKPTVRVLSPFSYCHKLSVQHVTLNQCFCFILIPARANDASRLFNKINKTVSIIFSSDHISIIDAQHSMSQVLFRSFYSMAVRILNSLPLDHEISSGLSVILIIFMVFIVSYFNINFVCFYSSTFSSTALELFLELRSSPC